MADPEGTHLLILARDPTGYTRLCRALSVAHLSGREKGRPLVDLETLAAIGAGALPDFAAARETDPIPVGHPVGRAADHWVILTGCRKGIVPAALVAHGPARAGVELERLQRLFGPANVVVELWDHGDPLDSARNDALVALAARSGAEIVATNNVHYHHPSRRRLATALAAVRARRSLDDIDGWLPAAAAAHLRSGAEQTRRFARYPGVVERAADPGPGVRLRPGPGGAQPPAVAGPARAHRDELAATPDRRGWHPPVRASPRRPPPPGLAPDRLRAGHDRPAWASPATS